MLDQGPAKVVWERTVWKETSRPQQAWPSKRGAARRCGWWTGELNNFFGERETLTWESEKWTFSFAEKARKETTKYFLVKMMMRIKPQRDTEEATPDASQSTSRRLCGGFVGRPLQLDRWQRRWMEDHEKGRGRRPVLGKRHRGEWEMESLEKKWAAETKESVQLGR